MCSEFWNSFWPNLASTILGLALGLPLALWTNREILKLQEKNQRQTEKERLEKAIEVIRHTIMTNKGKLEEAKGLIENSQVQFDTQIDTSAWDIVKGDITDSLHDSDLKTKIAFHFSRLNTLVKLNDMYIDLAFGVASAMVSTPKRRDGLRTYLIKNIASILTDGDEIIRLTNLK